MVSRSRARGSRSRSGRSKRASQRSAVRGVHVGPAIQAPDIASQHEALATRIIQERMEAMADALGAKEADGSDQDFRTLYELMRESYEVCDSLMAELELDPPLACKRGCVYCCYNQVSLTAPEALFLGFYLLETRGPQQLQELELRARALVERMRGKSRQEIGMERHLYPCLFLEQGNCSIYPARPLVCRGWNSVSEAMCLESNQSGDALTPIENHAIMRLLAESVQLGLLHGASALGLEAGYLLLARAMALLLDGGLEKNVLSCAEDWLSGGAFFARKKAW
ncbi:YkgJ family cysteine cluster protein [Oceanidesulfovibrio marinus]|uniref:YkgJ family cysteine cluster protein n=1 Tax=Oceanidesulfovibrio marinus TaxID=370038 RepID=A0ABX6NID3_9BACT|nr:YkgJ family cysteine cluster protein [Oceanidesulfovibrio marinus]QJT09455.1 YkgJ family cysteine cluster protein [Oceanidesulfovibrio marinus]